MHKMQLSKTMKSFITKEKGAVIVEATFVYPIMLFVILFLMYMGNMFYQKAKIDSYVSREAVKGAAYFADSLPQPIDESEAVPSSGKISIEPYRYLNFHPKAYTDVGKLEKSLSGSGFFAGMEPSFIPIEAKVTNYILYATYVIQVDYEISFPLKFIFEDDYYKLKFTSRAELPAVDSAEFIRNTDMIIDYMEHSEGGVGILEKISDGIGKLNELLGTG